MLLWACIHAHRDPLDCTYRWYRWYKVQALQRSSRVSHYKATSALQELACSARMHADCSSPLALRSNRGGNACEGREVVTSAASSRVWRPYSCRRVLMDSILLSCRSYLQPKQTYCFSAAQIKWKYNSRICSCTELSCALEAYSHKVLQCLIFCMAVHSL